MLRLILAVAITFMLVACNQSTSPPTTTTQAKPSTLYAWGWDHTYTTSDRESFPNLSIIQYRQNYARAREGDIAYVNTIEDAETVAATPDKWRAAILGDEHNHHTTPEAYNQAYEEPDRILRAAGIPTIASAVGMTSNGFDHDFVNGVSIGDAQGVNISPLHYRDFVEAAKQHPNKTWFVTLLPVRPNWWPWKYNTYFRWLHEVTTTDWVQQAVTLHHQSDVLGVGVWNLKEGRLSDGYYQAWHGMLDRYGRITRVGREALEILNRL